MFGLAATSHRTQPGHHCSSLSRQQQLIPQMLILKFKNIRPEYRLITAVQQHSSSSELHIRSYTQKGHPFQLATPAGFQVNLIPEGLPHSQYHLQTDTTRSVAASSLFFFCQLEHYSPCSAMRVTRIFGCYICRISPVYFW